MSKSGIVKKLFFWIAVPLVFCIGCSSAQKHAGEGKEKDIGAGAVWNPDRSFRERVVDRCSLPQVQDFGECFISVMQDSKAPPQAVAFARRIGNTGYLRGFSPAGVVDIAFVTYPFRANENYGCFLVNGEPPVVDIDDFEITKKIDLRKDARYGEIAAGFPKVDLWPGDRWGADCVHAETSRGAQRFLVTYRLLDGCHACELLGSARVAFDFDGSGKFLGTELIGIEAVLKVFTDPGKPVSVAPGGKFALVLESNRTTGYRWERSAPADAAILKFIESQYREPETGLPGAGGKDVLIFEAVGKGSIEIPLKYIRPWEKNVPPAKTVTFRVQVE